MRDAEYFRQAEKLFTAAFEDLTMRLKFACLAILASGVLAPNLSALAGDLSNGAAGGIRDYSSGGIAVPAPITYEENFKWYVRGDIGTGFKHSGTFKSGGWPIEVTQPGNWSEQSIVSVGFGQYLTPSFRAEVSVDYRTERSLSSGTLSLAPISIQRSVPGTVAVNSYLGTEDEAIGYQNTTLLLSGYFDLAKGVLRPYVGGGVGLAVHQLTRSGTTTYDCFDGQITQIGTPNIVTPGCSTTNGLKLRETAVSNATSIGYGLAAQVTAGIAYDITPRTHWDTSYRMMWQSGRVGVASSDGASTLHIGDTIEHSLRTGIRWDLW